MQFKYLQRENRLRLKPSALDLGESTKFVAIINLFVHSSMKLKAVASN